MKPNKLQKRCIAFAVAAIALTASSAHAAAVITYAGADITTNVAWRTSSVTKPLDADGNNIYGSDGYFTSSWLANSLPAYATIGLAASILTYPGNGSYARLDNAAGTATITSGVHYRQPGAGVEMDFYIITLTAAGSFRLGIITDNTDYAAISPSDLRVRQTAGGTANSGLISAASDRDRDGDYYFFDITGGQSGDVFVVSGVKDGTNPLAPSNGLAGITFDTIPDPFLFQLIITPNGANYDFSWDSRDGKLYDLVSSTDLATPVLTWPVYDPDGPGGNAPYEGIPSAGATTTLTAVPGNGPQRFFAMLEKDAPPPPPIFSEHFETDGGGFTATGTPNDWAWGTPNSNNNAGLVLTTGNAGSTGAWATNLGLGGTAPSGVIDPAADSILRSPAIDLTGVTGAKLSFAAAYDASSGDVIEIIVRNAGTDAQIATIKPVTATLPASSDWTTLGPFDLSAADNTNIYLEFRYDGTDAAYIGLYLDDVEVTQAP